MTIENGGHLPEVEMTLRIFQTNDSKQIPTAIPMFLGLGNMAELGRILFDRWVYGKSKIVVTTGIDMKQRRLVS